MSGGHKLKVFELATYYYIGNVLIIIIVSFSLIFLVSNNTFKYDALRYKRPAKRLKHKDKLT